MLPAQRRLPHTWPSGNSRHARHAPRPPSPPATLQVHAYLQLPGGRTGYLSELKTGAEVLVADAAGRTRTALVGRVKIESRPLVRTLAVCGVCGGENYCLQQS